MTQHLDPPSGLRPALEEALEVRDAAHGFVELLDTGTGIPVDRRDRLPAFHGIQISVRETLAALSVLVVGTGSVGMRIALELARLGIGRIALVDKGRMKPASLLTHPIHPDDVGRSKVWTVGSLCKAISPETRVLIYEGRFEELPAVAVEAPDLVALATDNLGAEVSVGRCCTAFGTPLMQASVAGEVLTAQARTFANDRRGDSACVACQFDSREWEHLTRQTRYSCEGALDESGTSIIDPTAGGPHLEAIPTLSVGFLCSQAADLLLTELFRQLFVTGKFEDRIAEVAGYTLETTVSPLRRNPSCPCEHVAYERPDRSGKLSEASIADLLRVAGCPIDAERLAGASLDLSGHCWIESGLCRCSTRQPRVRRFAGRPGRAGVCAVCRTPIHANPLETHEVVPLSLLADLLEVPLEELGAGKGNAAVLRVGPRVLYFDNPPMEQ